jgi:hypothetical protein
MKKILLLASVVLGLVMQVNAACYSLGVRNMTGCTLYYSAYTYTPPNCNPANGTNTIQILPGVTQGMCVGDPMYSWSPLVPNGVTDRWKFINIYTDPTLGCPVTGVTVGDPACGFPTVGVFNPSQGGGCPYANCPIVKATWTFTPPYYWMVVLQ